MTVTATAVRSADPSSAGRTGAAVRSAAFAVVFCVAVLLGRLTVMDGTSLSLVWPAAGVAVVWFAVQRRAGTRVLDLALLSAVTFAVNTFTGAPPALATAFVLANVVQVLVFGVLFTRWCPSTWGAGGCDPVTGVAQLMSLVAAAVLATATGAVLGPTAVGVLTGNWSSLAALVWLTRNTVSILLIAGTAFRLGSLLSARASRRHGSSVSASSADVPAPTLRRPHGWRCVEYTAMALCSVLAYGLVFGVFDGLPLAFTLIALTAWVALRFDTTIALLHSLAVGVFAVLMTLAGHGPFAAILDDATRAVVVQVYVGVVTALGLVLALGRDERDGLLARMAAATAASDRAAAAAAEAQARAEESQQRAESATAEAEARGELAKAVLESVDVGIVLAGADGRLMMFNRAAQDMHGLDADTGLDPGEHAGTYDLFGPDGTHPLSASEVPLARILHEDTFTGAEMVIAPTDRPPVTVTCSGRRMARADGTPLGAVVAMTDVTASRQSQRDLETARREAAEQAELLQLIFDNVSDGIRVMNRAGEMLLNNAAAERMLPVPGPGGVSHWDERYGYFHPGDERPFTMGELPLVRAVGGEQVDAAEMLVRNEQCPDGVILSISARPLPGPDGPRGAVAVFRDVTQERQQQEALRRSETQLQRAFDASLVGNVHLALDGTVLRVNAAAAMVLGSSPEAMPGRNWDEFVQRDGLSSRRESLGQAATGEARDSSGGTVRLVHRDGHTVHTQVSTTIVRDEHGRPLHAATQLIDISDRVAAEEKVRRQRDVYSRLLRALSDLGEGVLVEHGDQVTYVNDALARLTGRRAAELLTLPTSLLLVPDTEHDTWKARKDVRSEPSTATRAGSTGHRPPAVTALRRPDGTSVPVEITTVSLPDATDDATLTIVRDLSRRLRTEAALAASVQQLRDANQLKDDLVATLSHDLRQPLSTTIGFAEFMLEDWANLTEQDKRSHLTRIHRAGRWANDLLEDILTMAQLEQGAPHVHASRVHLPTLVADLLNRLGADSAAVDTHAVQDVTALADRGHLERILGNLLTNAFKYGRPPVRILARSRGDQVLVEVVDTGEGVPAEFVPQLFARFTRASSGVALQKRGTGLGLHIARSLAAANGGDLTYRPATSGGSRFTLSLNGLGVDSTDAREVLDAASRLPRSVTG